MWTQDFRYVRVWAMLAFTRVESSDMYMLELGSMQTAASLYQVGGRCGFVVQSSA